MLDILKKIGLGIFDFVAHFIRRVVTIVYRLSVGLICTFIYLVTFQPKTWHRATSRKARRIRVLTKLKLYAWKYGKWFFKWIREDEYLEKLYGNFSFLIEKNKKCK